MKGLRQILLGLIALATGACAADLTCDDPQLYQDAVEGRRVTAPEDLDNLQSAREIQIPRASPRDPRPPGSPCLDLPPTLSVGGSDDDDEEEVPVEEEAAPATEDQSEDNG